MYSTGNSAFLTYMAKESEKEYTYLYMQLNHFAAHLKLSDTVNQLDFS